MTITLAWVALFVILLALLLTGLLLFLLAQKGRTIRYEERKKEYKRKLKPVVQQVVISGEEGHSSLIQHDRIVYEALSELLEEITTTLKDSSVKMRVNSFAQWTMTDYYKRLLAHRRFSLRMNALYQIEDFKIQSFHEELWQRYKQKRYKNTAEHYQIVRTLSALHSDELVYDLLGEHHPYPKFLYKEIFRRLLQVDFERFLDQFDSLPVPLQQAVVEWIGEMKDYSRIPFLEVRLSEASFELRMSLLKVLESFGYVSNHDVILALKTSDHFQERMMVARIARVTEKERYKSVLVDLLSDSNWFVRQAAGEALTVYNDGDMILSHVFETSVDPYARDMAHQWLESEGAAWKS
ncbi:MULTISPECIES: HEAT repeat domain-containing protein [Pontibacillus]|uniref:HEAT repeat domain-containing protein n=1 Tax=Pontibacillus chungwhensis TaxID=265426 RepID=A0ABY8UWN6_9BACI|nr:MULTISPECIES: HEAT repeat domain-containing protein [Pontibacillus]MCD5325878.1 HEAT repeat domain-containing protein [Pontibacillus sp. HN14]WIF97588.1 HEAT repeat domain-containing protein [Pontibacillus chungwhensis]